MKLESTESGDQYVDYCLWPYTPGVDPAGKLRSVNLLYQSFELAGLGERAVAICDALREGVGPFRTVWGVKRVGQELSWEFYFYDYDRLDREVSLTRVLEVLSPLISSDLQYSERRPYFMFSLDLSKQQMSGPAKLDSANVYMGNAGSSVSSGICYELTRDALSLNNFYFFFDAHSEMEEIRYKIRSSAHLDADLDLDQLLWPELCDCKTIVVANKKNNEGIYFSRITVDQLILFMRRTGHPQDLTGFVVDHRDEFDHLLFDVGFDYVMEGGRIRVIKTSYYGVF